MKINVTGSGRRGRRGKRPHSQELWWNKVQCHDHTLLEVVIIVIVGPPQRWDSENTRKWLVVGYQMNFVPNKIIVVELSYAIHKSQHFLVNMQVVLLAWG